MVANTVLYHPSVDHYLRYVASTIGRDKVLRTIQYFSRFYSWYLFRTNATPAEIKPWDVTKKQFGLARKLMRVGKFVEHFKAVAVAADAKGMDPVLRYLAIGRQMGYGVYLSLDALTYPDASGIKPYEAGKKIQREAYRAWFVGLLCNTLAGIYALYHLRQREAAAATSKEGEGAVERKKIERERRVARMQLISDLCDLTVPGTALGYFGFDEGIVGLAGTVSSLLGVYTVWMKTA